LNGGLLGQEIDPKVQAFYQFQPLVVNASGIFPKKQSQCQVFIVNPDGTWPIITYSEESRMEQSRSLVYQYSSDGTKPISSESRFSGWNEADLSWNKISRMEQSRSPVDKI
jgi:hypothetical protein